MTQYFVSSANVLSLARISLGVCMTVTAATVAILAAGCGPSETMNNTAGTDGTEPRQTQMTTFDEFETERIERVQGVKHEWRDAKRFAPGVEHTFALEDVDSARAVRFGILAGEGSFVTGAVRQNEDTLWEFSTDDDAGWYDTRVALPNSPTDPLHVTLSSDSAFYVSDAELVQDHASRPPVIIFLIDTLRQDHLGIYGYDRDVSPNIDAFAADAIRFTQLVPPSSWTRPSIASLLTATYPGIHGANDRGNTVRSGMPWLADVLEESGYVTHGFMTNVNCLPIWGFGEDFDRYVDLGARDWFQLDDSEAVTAAISSLEFVRGRPFFFYVHTMAPHEPYTPPEPYKSRFERGTAGLDNAASERQKTIDRYDAEIAYIDSLFGEFVQHLRESGVYEPSLIIVLSDHGEEFWDHGGISHGKTLYEEQLRVPLLIKLPESRYGGSAKETLVEMVDIAPTILHYLELPPEPAFQGQPITFGPHESPGEPRVGFASLELDSRSMVAAKSVATKYIRNHADGTEKWFDLSGDPQELNPLSATPDTALPLKSVALARSRMGQHGLNILITRDATDETTLTGRIEADSLGDVEYRYPAEFVELTQQPGQVDFTVSMPRIDDENITSAQWRQALERDAGVAWLAGKFGGEIETEPDHFQLIVDVPLDATLTMSLYKDGEPVSGDVVTMPNAPRELRDAAVNLQNLAVNSRPHYAAASPAEFGVYIWYMPEADDIDMLDLAPEVQEALRGLGYLD